MLDKSLYNFKSNFLQIDSNNYHYLNEGSGKAILMVHGNPTWSFYYRNLVREFSKDYQVVVPDHLGCGLSSKPQEYDYSLKNHICNLEKLVKFLQLKSITLVVHDWGGAIGMGLAVKHSELFKKIIILNTAAFHLPRIPKRIALCKIPVVGEFLVRAFNAFAYPASVMTTVKAMPANVKAGYLHPYDSYKNRIAVARFVKDIPMDEEHPSYALLKEIESKLPELAALPKLILWGGQDFCFNETFYLKWLSIFPKAKHQYFKDAGHYVIEDKPQECIDEIRAFM